MDVHSYWAHTCELRAGYVRRRLSLTREIEQALVEAMGINSSSRRIRAGGPVGYQPREVVVRTVVNCLSDYGVSIDTDTMAGWFREVDGQQQAADDFVVNSLPGAREYVAHLCAAGVSVSVFTSDRKENATRILERLGMAAWVTTVVGGGCVRCPKPDPEGFLAACTSVGISPEFSAYVSDTVLDLRMARAGHAGATIGVTTGLDSRADLAGFADRVCDRLDELIGEA